MVRRKQAEHYTALGVQLDLLTTDDLLEVICLATAHDDLRVVIANHNLHSIYLYHHHLQMREFYAQAAYVHIDGMALVLLGRVLGLPVRREHRSTYLDLINDLAHASEQKDWRIFFLGSAPGVTEQAAARLRTAFPALQIESHHGYFDITPGSAANEAVLHRIATYRPQLLLVGMGMPRQELWITTSLEKIEANVILQVGGLFDYLAGVQATPPRWMGRIGLEWLHRLARHPRRLGSRYLVEPWFIVGLLLKAWVGRRRSPPSPQGHCQDHSSFPDDQ